MKPGTPRLYADDILRIARTLRRERASFALAHDLGLCLGLGDYTSVTHAEFVRLAFGVPEADPAADSAEFQDAMREAQP